VGKDLQHLLKNRCELVGFSYLKLNTQLFQQQLQSNIPVSSVFKKQPIFHSFLTQYSQNYTKEKVFVAVLRLQSKFYNPQTFHKILESPAFLNSNLSLNEN